MPSINTFERKEILEMLEKTRTSINLCAHSRRLLDDLKISIIPTRVLNESFNCTKLLRRLSFVVTSSSLPSSFSFYINALTQIFISMLTSHVRLLYI